MTFLGKLIGRYFDSNGNPTEYSKMVDTWVEQAKSEQNMKQTQEKMYPPCNIEWNAESGTRVWCTDKR